eukprot:TRINITY_DN10863_c1_g1_i2.p1 TRINITY_DN10863_c1_g1~~TRINITY_DN10863_c1_g1_i2.p1  ORF type:complete len:106 (-),score=5.81 TRINITY_DN10863_c1_g1_i2:163-480(-)
MGWLLCEHVVFSGTFLSARAAVGRPTTSKIARLPQFFQRCWLMFYFSPLASFTLLSFSHLFFTCYLLLHLTADAWSCSLLFGCRIYVSLIFTVTATLSNVPLAPQ